MLWIEVLCQYILADISSKIVAHLLLPLNNSLLGEMLLFLFISTIHGSLKQIFDLEQMQLII